MKRRPQSLRVLIIPDKFKGTLTAVAAATALARGWARGRSQDQLRILPLTDGGDGFGDCMRQVLGASRQSTVSVDAAHRPCRVPWWLVPGRRLAIVESACCIGLAMLPRGRYHPFRLDTLGLAKLLKTLAQRRVRACLMGIGGSATNDGGFGLALGLGWTFLDRAGRPIRRWTDLSALASVHPPLPPGPLGSLQLTVATDVDNPLLGRHGATRIYGPQKGLRPEDIPPAEKALRRLKSVSEQTLGRPLADQAGAGAAGGLGFGLVAFAGATLQSGIQVYARHAKLAAHLDWAQLILTGEGRMDASTLMGKGVGEIARQARSRGLPCIGIAGSVQDGSMLRRHFVTIEALTPDRVSLNEAMNRPVHWLSRLSLELASAWTHR